LWNRSIFSEPATRDGGQARELVNRLPDEAARDAAVMAIRFSEMSNKTASQTVAEAVPQVASLSATRSFSANDSASG
jgi:hypothetical protein